MHKTFLLGIFTLLAFNFSIAQMPNSLSQKNNNEKEFKPFEYIKNKQIINHSNNVTLEINRIIPTNLQSLLSIAVLQSVEESIVIDVCLQSEMNSCQDLFIAYKGWVNLYKKVQKEYADLGLWKGTFDYNVIFESPEILCITESVVYETDSYADMETLSYLLFDKKTAEPLIEEDLFKDFDLAIKTVEPYFKAYFLQEHDLEISDYTAAGFSFPDNVFMLPTAIGMNETEVLISFDKGEYIHDVYGAITVKVPKTAFGDNLLYR